MDFTKEREELKSANDNFIDKLFKKISCLEEENCKYQQAVLEYRMKNNQLNTELEVLEKDNDYLEEYIDNLEKEIKKLKNKISQYKCKEDKYEWNFINDIKDALSEENYDSIEEILDKAIIKINNYENQLTEEDIITLSYLAFFYSKLDKLMDNSKEVSAYIESNNDPAIGLRLLQNEEKAKVGSEFDDCYQIFIKETEDVFYGIDEAIKKFIIETSLDNSYRYYNTIFLYRENYKLIDIAKTKVFISFNDKFILVEGLFDKRDAKKENLMLHLDTINKYRNEVDSVKEIINNIENKFLSLDVMGPYYIPEEAEKIGLIDEIEQLLMNNKISINNLTKEQVYSLAIISEFCDVYENLISKIIGVRQILSQDNYENKLVMSLQGKLIINDEVILVNNFIDLYEKQLKNIKPIILKRVIEIARKYLPTTYLSLICCENSFKTCVNDNSDLKETKLIVKVKNKDGEFDYGKQVYLDFCQKCKTAYITQRKLDKLNKNKNFKCTPDKIMNTSRDKNMNVSAKLYEDVIYSYVNSKPEQMKTSILKLINNKLEVNKLSRSKVNTLMILGNFARISDKELQQNLKPERFGVGYESIIYKRLDEQQRFLEYLNVNKNKIENLDSRVKKKMLEQLQNKAVIAENKYKSQRPVEEIDSNNLSAESELKKLGYSTALTRSERWTLLKNKAIPKLGEKKVISHIRWLIKMNGNRSNRINAVKEWEHDLIRLLQE